MVRPITMAMRSAESFHAAAHSDVFTGVSSPALVALGFAGCLMLRNVHSSMVCQTFMGLAHGIVVGAVNSE